MFEKKNKDFLLTIFGSIQILFTSGPVKPNGIASFESLQPFHFLVGAWTNPSEKCELNWIISPGIRVKITSLWDHYLLNMIHNEHNEHNEL